MPAVPTTARDPWPAFTYSGCAEVTEYPVPLTAPVVALYTLQDVWTSDLSFVTFCVQVIVPEPLVCPPVSVTVPVIPVYSVN